MTLESPYKNAIRFQRTEQDDCDIWSGRTDDFLVDLFVRDDLIFQIDINGHAPRFVPPCEFDGECRCYFEEDDEWAEMDCPWGSVEWENMSSGRYFVNLPATDKILPDALRLEISKQVHPEFGAPASIIDLFSFGWIFMDEDLGLRTVVDGGHIERPKQEEE